MRARVIVVIVLLFGWVILIGPPQSWAPFFHQPFTPYLDALGLLTFTVLTLPGRLVLSLIWPGVFRLTLYQFWDGAPFGEVAIAAFAWTFTVLFSYVFWFTFL